MDAKTTPPTDLRSVSERARSLVQEARESLTRGTQSRDAEIDRLGATALETIEQLSAQVAAELAADAGAEQADALEQARAGLEAERNAWLEERSEWERVRDEVEAELAAKEASLLEASRRLDERDHASGAEAAAEREALLADFAAERRQAQETAAHQAERVGELEATLVAAQQALAEADADREKLALALDDLQALRAHAASLEEELAARPAPGESDAVELVQLRQERDDLLRRLEEAPRDEAGDDTQPAEFSELQARFELAVEDVRALKTENNELRERLANADAAAAETGDGDGSGDWEAQKRRLLAALEAEGEPMDAQRADEHATIQGTIQLTDEVVAEKDREIERLRAAAEAAVPTSAAIDEAAEALLDEDATIVAERARLASLEAEWEEKLRAAELELSVERAKIARQQSELAEQQMELETLRAATRAAGEGRDEGRKWLSKLGLSGDATKRDG